MLSIIKLIRLRTKITCLTSRIFPATYSINASQLKKKIQSPAQSAPIVQNLPHQNTAISPNKSAESIDITNRISNVLIENTEKNNIDIINGSKAGEWHKIQTDTSKLYKQCLMLSKIRLTSLVVITTVGGYALAPGAFDLQTLLMCSIGTGLVSATANSINQFFEVPFDAQMSRTKNRVLVCGQLTPAQAIIFATISGITGLSTLYFGVNGLTAALGATNLVIYTLLYTPMKRVSILNTWIGSIVGAIPPLMGWAGCMGNISNPGAWIVSGILYAWQFPHFNALSWNLRSEYSRAGYRMMAVTNPDLCRKTALRYTGLLMALSYLASVFNVTEWWFAVASTPLNAYFMFLAWKFYKHSDSANSRKLFRFSLVHLPLLMILMLTSKKHLYSRKNTDVSVTDKSHESIVAEFSRPIITLMGKV